jgi:signal peptidase I
VRRLANLALWGIIALLLAVTATVTLVPSATGLKAVNIVAGSMGEALPFGSLAYIDPKVEPTVGSIITYRFGEATPVSHRVTAIGPDPSGNGIEYTTRGDANKTDDPRPVYPENIIGVVVTSIPAIGAATSLLGKFQVQLFLALVALGLWWYASTPSRTQRRITEMKRQRDEANMPPPQRRLDGIRDMTVQRAAEPIHAYRASDLPLKDEPVTEEYL